MRSPLVLLPIFALTACSPVRPSAHSPAPIRPPAAERVVENNPAPQTELVEKSSDPTPARQATPARAPKMTRIRLSGIEFIGITFDSQTHHLIVVDQPRGPGSLWPDAESAARAKHGIAAINAGFFTPEGAPLGKVVSAGNPAGAWNRSSLGSGVFFESRSGILSIERRQKVDSNQQELLQAGPFLRENSRMVDGLSDGKTSARSFIAWDGANRWWIGRASPCTLKKLASTLAQQSPCGFPIQTALNLDGGRSSDLFISGNVSGGPIVERGILNRPVRNFLILTRKNP
ncbi:phosphodiester glycosidase family protein [Luteolibacter pohnpeiensis]|uniref:Phosphodiester glycosidase family protein n=1 Tax=Luteolibacter pohnpeiensis TaxID=454153 RepID=A0A934VVI9_9BACT|nr:phosphodiester glycosidase family protein [Luteolibacter pohnpeiensis]MBK1882230.1 phosphodiester glycosidase family protein [Luteolibacter pohnpeiensis]